MNIKKLWTKLLDKNSEPDEIALHVSGATVRHRSPFEELEVLRNKKELSDQFIDTWVVPFYMNSLSDADDGTVKLFSKAAKEIDIDIVKNLLGDFDWRPKITGAFFAAINNYKELEDIIGMQLLKSEVCYAGTGYCLALAIFKTDEAKLYLQKYLEYYLERKDLWFDQAPAFCALEFIDKNLAEKMRPKWASFISDKDHISLEDSRQHFNASVSTIDKIRQLNI